LEAEPDIVVDGELEPDIVVDGVHTGPMGGIVPEFM
jgi:hypothetical protein